MAFVVALVVWGLLPTLATAQVQLPSWETVYRGAVVSDYLQQDWIRHNDHNVRELDPWLRGPIGVVTLKMGAEAVLVPLAVDALLPERYRWAGWLLAALRWIAPIHNAIIHRELREAPYAGVALTLVSIKF